MASYNFQPDAVAATAVNPPAAPPSVYSGTLTPPAGASTAGQQASSSGGSPSFNMTPTKIPSSIIGGIDKFGGSIGFASPVTTGGVTGTAGVTVPGSFSPGAISAAPLSGVLTGAGIGGLVGALNPLAQGSPVGGIGGSIGGAIAAGAGFGPIGMAVGGLLGSSIGGIFGKKKPGVHASEFQTGVLDKNEFYKATGYGSKRADKSQAQGVHSDFTNYLNDIATKYNLDFTGAAFRGGFNDIHQGGFFLANKNDMTKGDPDTNPEAWTNFKIDPNSSDRYKAYSQVAAGMLASQGRMTKEISDALIKDTQERLNSSNIGGAGLGGKEPIIPNGQPSGKENFNDFLTRYRAGNLDVGPVTSVRDVEKKPDMNNPLVKAMI